LDLRGFLHVMRRYWLVVGLAAVLCLGAGAAFTILRPPLLASKTLVLLPPTTRDIATQVVIASSNPVLADAAPNIKPAISLLTLHNRVEAISISSDIIQITADGPTAAEAENMANAVAHSYIRYIGSRTALGGAVGSTVLERAVTATAPSLRARLLLYGGGGLLLGLIIGAIIAVARGRGDRRLRLRDEIADAIGVRVLASLPTRRPAQAAAWAELLETYEPTVVHAWHLRKALQHLGLTELREGSSASLTVVSLASDRGALAVGPQLAAFAASLGIPTALVVGRQDDLNATATLRAACTMISDAPWRGPGHLRVIGDDEESPLEYSSAALTIVVVAVDGRAPRLDETMGTTATVLAVSAGVATAEQLARVAVSAADDRREVAGIIVANPDASDHTTGLLAEPVGLSRRRTPTRVSGARESGR
jgi:capsular polysaccharide biosynthesis protein